MRFFLIILCSILILACSSTQVQDNSIVEKSTSTEPSDGIEPDRLDELLKANPQPAEEPRSGSPVGGALQSMDRSKKQMLDTIDMVGQLQGDRVLDCQTNPEAAFRIMQKFFGQDCFGYDEITFWFMEKTGKKIGLHESNGALQKCKIGIFMGFKQLTAYQVNDGVEVNTEFYLDVTQRELMVHRYRGWHRIATEVYKVSGN